MSVSQLSFFFQFLFISSCMFISMGIEPMILSLNKELYMCFGSATIKVRDLIIALLCVIISINVKGLLFLPEYYN